jgi:hypothetical protein
MYPLIDTQLSDVVRLLDVLLGLDGTPGYGPPPLAAARAAYLAGLRRACRTLDDQVLDLARACTDLFATALGLSTAAPSPRAVLSPP